MNPFRESIVANPWDDTRTDVTAIHGHVFDACLQGIEQVRTDKRSAAVLIHGEAGSGKTHLLSRLRSQLAPRAATATDRPEYLYVWVRLQTSPRMIWRTLRRTLVDDWFRPVGNHRSQFDRILFHRLAEIRVANGDLEPWFEYMLDEDPQGLQDLLERIAVNLDLDRNTAIAFEHIAFGRHRRDLRAWLAGASLPEAALARMDLSQDEGTDEEREDQARQVVLMLCRLAGRGLPIVLSFDQVEALQMNPRDLDGQFAFGQMVSTIHDSTQNVLIISCVQSSFSTQLRDQIRGADYDRMTSLGTWSLDSLTPAQAQQLIAARLIAANASVPDNVADAATWPLGSDRFSNLFAKGNLTPRKLLGMCAEAWDAWQLNPNESVDSPVAHADELPTAVEETPLVQTPALPGKSKDLSGFLDDKWRSTLEAKVAVNSPDLTDVIVWHGLPLLTNLIMPELKLVQDELLPDVPLLFEGPNGRTGLSIRTESNMNSLGSKFKHLGQQLASGRLQRLVVVRDSRRPLSKAAKVAQKNLDDLTQQGAVVVFPSEEVLAALDALRDLLSDAKSGDLDCDGETVLPQTVEEWLILNTSNSVRDFVAEVFGTGTDNRESAQSDAHDVEALNGLLVQTPMLPLAEAAQAIQRPVDVLLQIIARHPEQFGILGEPPKLLFRIVETE